MKLSLLFELPAGGSPDAHGKDTPAERTSGSR